MDKRALFLSFDFPPMDGGVSRLSSEIVSQFQNKQWEVEVISSEAKCDYFSVDGYSIYRVKGRRGIRELKAWLKLFFTKDKSRLLITSYWYPEGLIAKLAGFKNLVILAHGAELLLGKKSLKNSILNLARKWILKKSQLIICNSHYTESLILNQFPHVNTKVCLLGVDIERFTPLGSKGEIRSELGLPIDKKIVLSISRIEQHKGHDVVLKAIAKIPPKDRKKLLYCIAGQGKYKQKLIEQSKELGIEECVYWYGFAEEDKLVKLYNASDLFVLCSREEAENKNVEGFGLVFLEAQSCAIPVIGTTEGGISDAIVHEEGGWLIDKDDAVALNEYFMKLIDNSKLFKAQGIKGRQRVSKSATWGHFSTKVFKHILESKKK